MEVLTNTDISTYKELLPILASTITAIATLLGVFIASYFNQKNNEKVLDKNIKQEKIKILLGKVEEIYDHFYLWETSITATQMAHYSYYSGVYSQKQLYEQIGTNDNKGSGNSFRKVQSLSDIYFPEISVAFKDVLASRDVLAKCFFGKQQTQKACDNLIFAYKAFEKEADKFKGTLGLVAKNL